VTVTLADNRYGKSRVRLVRVDRQRAVHEFQEWAVDILLQGAFLPCFADGDNSRILATDTMKNIVYSLARKSSAECIEEFAKELCEFILSGNPQISEADVSICQEAWQHLSCGGKPHPTTFVKLGTERQTARVVQGRAGGIRVESGITDLVIMKTADSAFEGFIRDGLTTLAETSDRLFGTSLRATWVYSSADLSYASARNTVRESLLAAFASHKSKSVQHTLYAMAQSALAAAGQISEITLSMPNKHCLPVDLSRFGQDNPNHIFVPTDEPHGTIEARICRGS
jgi:urate oxidase